MAMETISGGRQYLEPAVDRQTAIDECNAAFADARELASEVSALVDRLVGPTPPANTEAKGIQTQIPGILNDLSDNGRRTRNAVAAALKDLRRLESQLP